MKTLDKTYFEQKYFDKTLQSNEDFKKYTREELNELSSDNKVVVDCVAWMYGSDDNKLPSSLIKKRGVFHSIDESFYKYQEHINNTSIFKDCKLYMCVVENDGKRVDFDIHYMYDDRKCGEGYVRQAYIK